MKKRTALLGGFLILAMLGACQGTSIPPASETPLPSPTITPTFTPVPSATPQPSPTLPPFTATPANTIFDALDQNGTWEVYTEGSPTWYLGNVANPSLDGNALQCSIRGGVSYSNVHCYQNLPEMPGAVDFELNLSFWFSSSTCNNQNGTSVVQALEFTMNKWQDGQRYEFALQWQNVGSGAPQWRYWDPNNTEKWTEFLPQVTECLAGDRWNTLRLTGNILDGQVHYKSFTINGQEHPMDVAIAPVSTPDEPNRLAIAVQLDGNASQTPYDVFVDDVFLTVGSTFGP